jgi:hypothetical protein
LEVIMTAVLEHAVTGARIAVEIPPTGLSDAYARSGWHPTDKPLVDPPAPAATPKPAAKAVLKPPAEPGPSDKEN